MNVQTSQITKVLIDDIMGEPFKLDPVTVILEDLGPNGATAERVSNRGMVIIECYGKSWSNYWGAMGDRTVAQFFCDCSDDYIIGCIAPYASPVRFSSRKLVELAKRSIILRRRGATGYSDFGTMLDKKEARQLYDDAGDLRNCGSLNNVFGYRDLPEELFGPEWWHYVDGRAVEPCPNYQYLERVVAAAQAGLREVGLTTAKSTNGAQL